MELAVVERRGLPRREPIFAKIDESKLRLVCCFPHPATVEEILAYVTDVEKAVPVDHEQVIAAIKRGDFKEYLAGYPNPRSAIPVLAVESQWANTGRPNLVAYFPDINNPDHVRVRPVTARVGPYMRIAVRDQIVRLV